MDQAARTRLVYGAIAAALLAIQMAVLHHFGQPAFAATGHLLLWVNDPLSPDNSQQLADWYSFSHIIHGFVFFGILQLAAPRAPVVLRLLIAMGVEIAWEIAENTPAVIEHYRKQALAVGYRGDSIFNSLSDTAMMVAGFFIAARAKARYVIGLAVALEIFTLIAIRDNLTLNVINLIAPSDWAPIRAIHEWQAHAGEMHGSVANPLPSDWVEVHAGKAFSMKAPRGTNFRSEQGIDSFAAGFDGPGFTMEFDYGIYSPRLDDHEHNPRYAFSRTVIDRYATEVVSGPVRGNEWGCKKLFVAAHIQTRLPGLLGQPNALTISACVEREGDISTVKAIFGSIHFTG